VSKEVDQYGVINGNDFNFDLGYYWTSAFALGIPIKMSKRFFEVR
jgi:hypothetical protein